jgi:alpha-tubulin suppressor-like RCC1 family protein
MLLRIKSWVLVCLIAGSALGCGDDAAAPGDAGMADTGPRDTGSGPVDTGPRDAFRRDAPPDAGCTDCGIIDLASGLFHTCALRENGTTLCWGRNTDAELGDIRMRHAMDCGDGLEDDCSSRPELTSMVDDAVEISASRGPSTCVRDEGGTVQCWGLEWMPPASGTPREKNYEAVELGVDDAIDLGNGDTHLCIVHTGGTITCRGRNSSGQLGDGSRMDRLMPVATMDLTGVIDVEVSVEDFSCARTADAVWCWGANDLSQLGDGPLPHEVCMVGPVIYDCSTRPVQVDLLTAVDQISVGGTHVCARRPDGTVACWGANHFGQLGDGTRITRDVPTDVPGITDAIEVTTGYDHTCIVRATGDVVCFGNNNRGRLGDADNMHDSCTFGADVVDCSSTPVPVMGLSDATQIAAGLSHTCATRETGEVVCWGTNLFRQLGDGTQMDRSAPVPVMGLE